MNVNNNAIKRIMADVRALAKHPSHRYSAAPLEDNIFEWHFSIRGPSGTDFEGYYSAEIHEIINCSDFYEFHFVEKCSNNLTLQSRTVL